MIQIFLPQWVSSYPASPEAGYNYFTSEHRELEVYLFTTDSKD